MGLRVKTKTRFPKKWNRFFDALPPHSGDLRQRILPVHSIFRYPSQDIY
jgi:hypothetical protein